MKIKACLLFVSALALLTLMLYSGHQLWGIHQNNVQEAQMHRALMQYRPLVGADLDEIPMRDVNQSIVDLQILHPDTVGWLSVPNTKIDYPFVQGEDNAEYLHLDLDGEWSAAGTLFMDAQNNRDFSDFNTIIYGHHMQNGSMFGTLQHFNDQTFFAENPTGIIVLSDTVYQIQWMAFAVIRPDDAIIYNPTIETDKDKLIFLEHVSDVARHYRDLGVNEDDHMVSLSSCNYEFPDARMVLIGKLLVEE